jgi:predicted TPR repeat methyltransferase
MTSSDDSSTANASEVGLPEALALAMKLHFGGNADAAEEICRRILAAAPEHPDALHFLGLSRYQRGEHRVGMDLLGRALAAAPDHADARNNLGNMFLEHDRLDDAEQTYRRVLALRPEHASAHANLGLVLFRKRDLVGAEASLRQAIRLDPKNGEAYHNLGSVLSDAGRDDEALGALQHALALRPYDGGSYRRVGAALSTLGRLDDAAAIYKRWLELDPNDPVAEHMLRACSGQEPPARVSDAFVRSTFDKFATSFDEVLHKLDYRAPALVLQAVSAALGSAPAANLDVLDAGAGTGLCGPGLRAYARRLVAVDLSPAMLAKAAERGVYDQLDADELVRYMAARPAAFDVIVSADTLVYFGDLAEALRAACLSLRSGGLVVFTVEHATDDPVQGYRLNPHGRYSHGRGYVERTLADAGFESIALEPAHLRREHRVPVDGLVVTARRTSS